MSTRELWHAEEPTRSFRLVIDGGGEFDQWTIAEVSRDLKDFAGAFTFSLRDYSRSIDTFDYASPPALFRVRPGPSVKIYVDGQLELVGFIETVTPDITPDFAEVTISGRDKAGDLIDCACAANGPGELTDVKLEDAVKTIAAPFDLKVTSQIDTGKPFPRYPLGLGQTGLAAIEQGARQRHALVLSDGQGGIVLTRTGADQAPADLKLPGNMLSSSMPHSHENRFSETIVRGQSEKARGKRKGRKNALDGTARPLEPGQRQPGDGSATARERAGTAITGRAVDPEIKRYRPKVHLTRTQPDDISAQDEADWRMRTARAESEELVTAVWGYGVDDKPWRVNQLAMVEDRFQGIKRKLVISRTTKLFDDAGRTTELTLNSPEAFDKAPVSSRRNNLRGPSKSAQKKSRSSNRKSGSLDGSARAL